MKNSLYSKVELFLAINKCFTNKRGAMLASLVHLQRKKSFPATIPEIRKYSLKKYSMELKPASFKKFISELNNLALFPLIEIKRMVNLDLMVNPSKEHGFMCSEECLNAIEEEVSFVQVDENDDVDFSSFISTTSPFNVTSMNHKVNYFTSLATSEQDLLINSSITIDSNLQAIIKLTKSISSNCDILDFHPLITVYLCRIYEYLGIINKDYINYLHSLIMESSKGVEKTDQALYWTKIYISWAWVLQRTNKQSELKELIERMKNFDLKKDTDIVLRSSLPFYTEMARILIKVDQKKAIKIWKSKIPKIFRSILNKKGINFSNDFDITKDDSMLKDDELAEVFLELGEYLAEFIKSLLEEKMKKKEKIKIEEVVIKLLKPFYSIFNDYHLFMLPFGNGLSKLFLLNSGKFVEPSIAESYILGIIAVDQSQQGEEIGRIIAFMATMAYNYRIEDEVFEDTPDIIEFLNTLPISGKITIMMAKSINEDDEYYKKLFNRFIEPLLSSKNADPESNIITDEFSLEQYDFGTIIEILIEDFSLLPSKPQAEYIYQAIKNLKHNTKKIQLLGMFFIGIAQNNDYAHLIPEIFEYVQEQLSINENYRNDEESDTPIIMELYRLLSIYYKAFLLACDKNYLDYLKKLEILNKMMSILNEEGKKYIRNNYFGYLQGDPVHIFCYEIQGRLSRERLAEIARVLKMLNENNYLDHNDFI